MPLSKSLHLTLNYLISAVWLANGFFCKVLNWVPRHEQIVARILGETHAALYTIGIGLAETGMAFWIVSRIMPRINAITQIIVIAAMNILEFLLVPDLLLWGKANSIFAGMFILLIYYNAFVLPKKFGQQK